MTSLNHEPLSRSDLYYFDRYPLRASGVFAFSGAAYNVTFDSEDGVRRCLDAMMACPDKPTTPRFALRPEGYRDDRPEWPVCVLRFDYDIEHQVAAAVMLTLDKEANTQPWMSRGTVGRHDVELTYDSWAPQERPFPPESFITIAELREVVVQWAPVEGPVSRGSAHGPWVRRRCLRLDDAGGRARHVQFVGFELVR